MKTRKQILNDRIRRIAQHRDAPSAPVDAATLLHAETQRCYAIGGRLANKMAWSFRLAAAKLESWCDPACLVRYQKITPMPNLVQKWRAKAVLFTGQAGAWEDRGDANGANACRCVASTFEECAKQLSDLSQQNVYVLPPGKGRAVGVDVVVFMPVGSDDLFDFFDGSVTRNLRTHPAGNPSGCRAKSWASVPTCGHPTQICASYRGIKAVPGLSPIALAESTTVFPPSQLCLNVDNPQSESSSYVRPP